MTYSAMTYIELSKALTSKYGAWYVALPEDRVRYLVIIPDGNSRTGSAIAGIGRSRPEAMEAALAADDKR